MNLHCSFRGLVVLSLLGALAGMANAQPPGRRPGGFGGGGGPGGGTTQTSLLSNEKIQTELGLIDDQKKDLESIRNETREKMGPLFEGFRDLSQEQREAKQKENEPKMEAIAKESQEKMKDVLLPHQKSRLLELFVQIRGASALIDPDVVAALNLTDAQQAEIKTTREDLGKKMSEMFQGFGRRPGGEGQARPEGGGDPREKMEALRNETNDKLMAVLTTKQRDEFEKMKGEKFDFDPDEFRFGGGRGPGGPGGGRPGGDRRPGGNNNGNDT